MAIFLSSMLTLVMSVCRSVSSSSFIIARRPSNIFNIMTWIVSQRNIFLLQYIIYTYYNANSGKRFFVYSMPCWQGELNLYGNATPCWCWHKKELNLKYRNFFRIRPVEGTEAQRKYNGSVAQPVVRPGFYKINALGKFRKVHD